MQEFLGPKNPLLEFKKLPIRHKNWTQELDSRERISFKEPVLSFEALETIYESKSSRQIRAI